MGSTRLPGKVLAPLAGRPVLARIIERLNAVEGLDGAVVLTSTLTRDDPIAAFCDAARVALFRGDEADVLDRYQQAALALAPERIVRITADCPLVDPEVVGAVLALADAEHGGGDCRYASVATGALPRSAGLRRFPDGLDVEAFTATALGEAWAEAAEPFEREHVTPFLWRRPERFGARVLEADEDFGDERWTVDHQADLDLVGQIYERLGNRPFGYRDVVAALDAEPELRALNARHRVPDRPRQ